MNAQMNQQSSMSVIALTPYEEDDYTWALEQINLLRSGNLDRLDTHNLADELEMVLANLSGSLDSHLRHVLSHMLKWEYQSSYRIPDNRSWRNTILNGRLDIAKLMKKRSGLEKSFFKEFPDTYQDARLEAACQTNLPLSTFPEECPWTHEQVLDVKFLPGIPFKAPEPEKKRSQKGKRKR